MPFPKVQGVGMLKYDSTSNNIFGSVGAFSDTSTYKFGGASGRFVNGGYLQAPNNPAMNFGTGDFTIAWWMYCAVSWASMTSPGVIGQKASDSTNGWQIYRDGSASQVAFRPQGSTTYFSTTANAPVTAAWEHWAIVRTNGTLIFFKNGIIDSSYACAYNISDTTAYLQIGKSQTWGGVFTGCLDDIFVANTAVWTANFTPEEVAYTAPTEVSFNTLKSQHSYSEVAVPAPTTGQLNPQNSVHAYYAGRGYIAATVAIKGTPNTPVTRRVRLHEQKSGNFVAETWSNSSGSYAFTGIDPSNTYYAVSFDHTGAYQGVVADNLVPTVM